MSTTISVNKTDELYRLLNDARDLAATYEAHLALQQPVMDAAFAYCEMINSRTANLVAFREDFIEAVRLYRNQINTLDVSEHHDDLTAATAAEVYEWVIICPNDSDTPDIEECSSESYARTTLARHFYDEPGAFIARRRYVYTEATA